MHKDKTLPIVLFAGALIALPALASVETEQAKGVRRAFGPPAGTVCEYELKVTTRFERGEHTEALRLTVYRSGADDASIAAVVVQPRDSSQPAFEPPVAFFRVDEQGRARVDESGVMRGRYGTVAQSALFIRVQGPGLTPGTKWQQKETVTSSHGFALRGVDVEHVVTPDADDASALRLQSRMTAERKKAGFGAPFTLTGWKRDLLVDARTGRPRSVRVESQMEYESREGVDKTDFIIELKEVSHRALTAEQLASLPGETKALKAVLAAAYERERGPSRPRGLLARLFGFGGKKKAPGDPNALLDAYVKNHPEGVLVAAAEPLRKHINWRLQQEQQQRHMETRAAQMLNQPAPDFTLKDLNDKDVSLSDFKGKVVMLSFWGYG